MFDFKDSEIRDRFLIADPGLFRLRSAIRGTVTVFLSTLVLWEISESEHKPFVLGLVGAMLAMNGSMVVDDRTVREQRVTALWIPPTAAISLALGVAIAPWRSLVYATLFIFTFFAIYVRQFGSRWNTLGGMAYISFFSSIFFRVPSDQTGFVLAGIAIAGAFSYGVKFWVIPDRAESAIRWSLSAYRASLRRFSRAVRSELSKAEQAGRAANREAARSHLVRINELALLSEDSILNASDAIPGSGALVRALQGKVFDLELTSREIFESMGRRTYAEIEAALAEFEKGFALLKAQATLAEDEEEAARATGSPPTKYQKVRYTPLGSRFHFQTRQAIQATLATMIASVGGTFISADRWYWAPLTAYIVFTGTTRGDNLRRAFQRMIGTIVGVMAGLGLAAVLQGHHEWQMIALFLTMFCAIFSVRASYSLYAIWITTLVALFYSMLGLLTPDLLYLRIEQTFLGGATGAAIAFLVFPVSTRTSLRIELARFFQMLSDQLRELVSSQMPRRERRLRVRALERELMTLRAIAGPLKGPLGRPVREETRLVVHGAAALVHFARQILIFSDSLQANEKATALAERAANLALRVETAKFKDLSMPLNEPIRADHEPGAESLARLEQAISAFESRFTAQS